MPDQIPVPRESRDQDEASAELSTEQSPLLLEQRQEALWCQLNRPRRRNALTVELVAELARAIEDAPSQGARTVVIAGSPGMFCAGGDLADLSEVADQGPITVADTIYGNFHRLVRTLRNSPLPVLAIVDGPALGAGFDLTLACDLRLATARASFASSWIGVGLIPGMGGAYFLPALIGASRAAQMLLLGGAMSGLEAQECGLVAAIHSPDDLDAAALEVASRFGQLSTEALGRTKAALNRGVDALLNGELAALGAIQGALLTGPAFQSATSRFRRH